MFTKNWKPKKIIAVRFYRSLNGVEPVRNWLKQLAKKQKKIIGEDIKTVELGWPIGMPLVRSLGKKLWEVRITLPNEIARVIFVVIDSEMILLHAFIKKDQKTPKKELDIALKRSKELIR